MPMLSIACSRPGLIRGGVRHPRQEMHLLGRFTPDQLREMLAEPELSLVIGRPLTAADIAAIEAAGAVHPHTEHHNPQSGDASGAAAAAGETGAAASADPTAAPGRSNGRRGRGAGAA